MTILVEGHAIADPINPGKTIRDLIADIKHAGLNANDLTLGGLAKSGSQQAVLRKHMYKKVWRLVNDARRAGEWDEALRYLGNTHSFRNHQTV